MFNLKEALKRLAGRGDEIAAGRALRQEPKAGVEKIETAIERLEKAGSAADAEIEQLEKARPALLIEGDDADLTALDNAIAETRRQGQRSRALAESLKEPLALAKAEAEQRRRQEIFDKVGPAIGPHEKKFLTEYTKAYAALKGVIDAAPREPLRELYNAALEALPEGKAYYDIPGRGFLEVTLELIKIFKQMRSPREIESEFLFGAYERREAEEARRKQAWDDGREAREQADREEQARQRRAAEERERADRAAPDYVVGVPHVLHGDPSTHYEQKVEIAAEARRQRAIEFGPRRDAEGNALSGMADAYREMTSRPERG
jgi:hypothetical protein